MKRKQQMEKSEEIAMITSIGIALSLTVLIRLGKSTVTVEAKAHTPIQWIPTPEDQAYMDSMRSIDATTKADIDSIRCMIQGILDKLE